MMEREWQCQCRELLEIEEESDQSEKLFNLVTPRSRCPSCGHLISALENIPVISYLFLRGKCKECGKKISLRYPAIELLTGLLSAYIAWRFGFEWSCLAALVFTWSLIALIFIDFDTQYLPDSITLPVLWLGLLISLNSVFIDSHTSIIGAVVGYLSLWSVYQIFKIVTGKEGMGHGDFKLLAMLGAWTGWQYILLIILLSSLSGTVIQLALMKFAGKDKDIPFSFGPYLGIGGFIAFLWGEEILRFYWSL